MKYHVTVYREDLGVFFDREFDFFESSHKVTDEMNIAVDQLVAEGGQE